MSGVEIETKNIALSVIIPCFNHGNFILEAIASVENCQESIYEIIIVDDGSTDIITKKNINYLKDKGYTVIEQNNQGLSAARNTGIKIANGRYFLPLDADNKIRPEYITKSIKILDKHPEVGIVYGDAEYFGELTGIWRVASFHVNTMLIGNYIDACAVIRKTVWKDCGGYDSNIPDKLGYEDWDFWLSAIEQGWKFYHIPEVLFDYQVRSNSMVSGCNIPENRRKLMQYITTKHLGLYTTHFANILGAKDYRIASEELNVINLEKELQQVNASLEKFQKNQANIEEYKNQLHQEYALSIENYKEQLQQTRLGLDNYQIEMAKAQESLLKYHHHCLETEKNIKNYQEQIQQMQASLEHYQKQTKEMQASLEHYQAELHISQAALTDSQTELQHIKNIITWMESSKFWKIRQQWLKVKKMLGLGKNDS